MLVRINLTLILGSELTKLRLFISIIVRLQTEVLVCLQSKIELEPKDKNGKTPLLLARSHRHDDIVRVLEGQKKKKDSWMPPISEIW